MSWFSKSWRHRIPFMILNPSTGNSRDGTFTVPSDLSLFWDNVQQDLDDLRVTAADGITLLTYKIASLNYANKTVEIQIDGYDWSSKAWGSANTTPAGANTAASAVQGFIYFGNDDAASAADANTSISNAETLTVQLAAPGSVGSPVLVPIIQSASQTTADNIVVKQSNDNTKVWWDLRSLMLYRSNRHEGSPLLEEIAWVRHTIEEIGTNSNTDRTSTMLDAGSIGAYGYHYICHDLKGGTSGKDHLLTLLIGTDDGMGGTRIIEQNATVKVLDLTANTD